MTIDVQVIRPNCNLQEVAQTDRDITLRAVASGNNIHNTNAREIMSSPIIYCFEDQDIEEVSRIILSGFRSRSR